jgi:hypothetical protein
MVDTRVSAGRPRGSLAAVAGRRRGNLAVVAGLVAPAWVVGCGGGDASPASPSAGSDAAVSQDVGQVTEPTPDTGGSAPEASSPGPDAAETDAAETDAASDGSPCPASAPAANQYVVYGDGPAAGWEYYGFHGSFAPQQATVCSGTEAVLYHSGQYDGVAFDTDTMPVTAVHLSVRVHVDVDSDWAVAAVKPGETDPHQFLGNPNTMHWTAGWHAVELDIPSTTPQTRWILFEKQDGGQTEIVIDDLRLTRSM